MTIELSQDLEQLVQEKAKQSGLDTNTYVLRVLRQALGVNGGAEQPAKQLTGEQRARFFAEVDRDPPSEGPPLSDEALVESEELLDWDFAIEIEPPLPRGTIQVTLESAGPDEPSRSP